jgi:hypothetical protein
MPFIYQCFYYYLGRGWRLVLHEEIAPQTWVEGGGIHLQQPLHIVDGANCRRRQGHLLAGNGITLCFEIDLW